MTEPAQTPPAFRERGRQATRPESFGAAALAFSLTKRASLFDALPDTVAELREALRRWPAFVFCFVYPLRMVSSAMAMFTGRVKSDLCIAPSMAVPA
ncbi:MULTISPECIES: hypothetical protein [unclassified Lysobacter]|uniref:hypothetical protein n=1 Tax=unclassified Lysobacter TaxID=2635362 RepID=UPI0006FD7403|nr:MULTISPECIES: hypothetical protein [unclassified Lysobacter]KRC36575.1 hypothetical protein ASE10_05525 [Lysobacter sp. Root76]KRD66668.1 hypothetical protein ASE45_15175 [Lysobacter sp. Root96]